MIHTRILNRILKQNFELSAEVIKLWKKLTYLQMKSHEERNSLIEQLNFVMKRAKKAKGKALDSK